MRYDKEGVHFTFGHPHLMYNWIMKLLSAQETEE